MAAQQVTSPDQHKPEPLKTWRAIWIAAIAALLVMLLGNHTGRIEDLFLIGIAALIAFGLIADGLMRKRGWKAKA